MDRTPPSLLERLREHSNPADWQKLSDLYRPWLLGWLVRQDVHEADAEDLVQEILIVVLRELPHFQHNQRTGAFRSWLRTIAVHRLRDAIRGRRYRPTGSGDSAMLERLQQLEDPASALSQQWELEHDRQVVNQLLKYIEPDFQPTTWQAFLGVMMEGRKPAAVAEQLSISVNAVLLAKSRILARLRQEARGLVDKL